ncbi:aldehyde dehydrogenase family protein [Candidatus Berkiella cookevillensis]|uniref:aldehyde dehydrogenase (NAD(+)) n=1 Tax=Candidatus Berkiella cookevillensis TaxID=437022 RepID=A0A0Q9Y959_9GAMM|nr:aldehyde dehydrogenase family protein [Candidatus Berkiella cookevillensis]MCS5707735.1 aldehyde dehydrogenase family protein [Candidatus Berkiella cookevillensis]
MTFVDNQFLSKLAIKNVNSGASAGEWLISDAQADLILSENPSQQTPIASIAACSLSQYEQVMRVAVQDFNEWRQIPAPKRGELIRIMGELLRQNKDALGSLVALEMGKSKQEGDGEVQEMIDIADFAVGQSRMLYGLTMHSERAQHRMYEQWHPLGVVGVISAFNFPVAVWAWNAFIAAICGNTVVWKPSSKTPLCAVAVQNICHQAMQQFGRKGVFYSIIPKARSVSDAFVQDKRVPLISFTGSCKAGIQVNQSVAKRMGRTILELGGNNAIIVDETADLKLAIPAIVFGAVGTAGQRCTSTRRLIVHHRRYEELCLHLKNAYAQISIGNPLDTKNLMGPLIDEAAVSQYLSAIEKIKAQGGEIIFGGKRLDMPGYFVEPTLVKAKNEWPIVQEETFAPILYVMSYQSIEEAITLQNGVVQGLSSAIFTDSIQNSEYFLSAMGSDCGIANVNIGTSGAEIGGAFGGEKETGGGREAGSDAWKAYMRRQTNTINWGKTLPLAQGIEFKI